LNVAPSLPGVEIPESSLCSFNYVDGNGTEVKCDEGEVTIHTVTVTGVDTTTPDPDNIPDVMSVTGSAPKTLSCAGRVRNCMAGPVVDELKRGDVNSGFTSKIKQFKNDPGVMTLTVNQGFPDKRGNFHAANFMRQCSGVANFNVANNFTPLPGVEFNPDVMQSYSALGVSTSGVQLRDDNGMDIIPLADHPFRGGIPMSVVSVLNPFDPLRAYGVNRLATQPFYTFSCLDKAYDLKARIRVAVREWNRNFSSSTQNFQFVSDVYNRALPFTTRTKMDAGSPVALLDYPTMYDEDLTNNMIDFDFNNLMDWDDLLPLTNSPTGACGAAINVDGSWVTPLAENPKSGFWFPFNPYE
jgi:hypothetical protein